MSAAELACSGYAKKLREHAFDAPKYVVENTVDAGRGRDAVLRGAGWSHAIRYRLAQLIGMVELKS